MEAFMNIKLSNIQKGSKMIDVMHSSDEELADAVI